MVAVSCAIFDLQTVFFCIYVNNIFMFERYIAAVPLNYHIIKNVLVINKTLFSVYCKEIVCYPMC